MKEIQIDMNAVSENTSWKVSSGLVKGRIITKNNILTIHENAQVKIWNRPDSRKNIMIDPTVSLWNRKIMWYRGANLRSGFRLPNNTSMDLCGIIRSSLDGVNLFGKNIRRNHKTQTQSENAVIAKIQNIDNPAE